MLFLIEHYYAVVVAQLELISALRTQRTVFTLVQINSDNFDPWWANLQNK